VLSDLGNGSGEPTMRGWAISKAIIEHSIIPFYSTQDSSLHTLTLIELGQVKVDLTTFDLKLRENLSSTLFCYTYSCRKVLQFFFLTHNIKNDV
jgi:hypothetical protein